MSVQLPAIRIDSLIHVSLPAMQLLTAYVLLLYLVPANRVVVSTGAAGTPATVLALGLTGWFLIARFAGPHGRWPPMNAGHHLLASYGGLAVLAYVVGGLRPLTPLELNGANRAMLATTAYLGMAALVIDTCRTIPRLERLLHVVSGAGAVMATVGLVQFVTGIDPLRSLHIPGLVENFPLSGVSGRSLFNRPRGSALHPIEFGVLSAALLPLALHGAIYSPPGPRRRRARIFLALIATGVPISISRSAVVALLAAGVAMVGAWDWRRRLNVVAISVAFTGAMWATVPGLLGTIRGLFVNVENDPSITARTERLPRVAELFNERPLFGRGIGTFSVDDYFLVDNQWYVSAIELGIVGLCGLAALLASSYFGARWGGRRSGSARERHLGYAVGAGILGLAAAIGTFDAFYFRIFSGTLWLLIGCAWALVAIARDSATARHGEQV